MARKRQESSAGSVGRILTLAVVVLVGFAVGRLTAPSTPQPVAAPAPPPPAASKAPAAKAEDSEVPPEAVEFLRKYDGMRKKPLWVRSVSTKEKEYLTKSGKLKPAYSKERMPDLTVDQLPPRKYRIIDNHEHIRDEREAKRLLEAMDELGIQMVALMGTSIYTLTLNNKYGFEQHKENNEEIIRIANKWPKRFAAFPTIRPDEEGNLELLKDYASRGAQGLKLYLGHGAKTGKEPFHVVDLDDPKMMVIYEWAQETQFPLAFHVNFLKYYDEFMRVMEAYPHLRVCVPHFGLFKNNKKRLARLSWLLDRYPNFYTDVGFGWYKFMIQGFEKIAAWPSRFREFMKRHGDKVMFSTDMVLEPLKDDDYIRLTLRGYMQILEMEHFRFLYRPAHPMRGLALSEEVLRKIYEETPRRYLLLDEQGNLPDRTRGWPPPGWQGSRPGVPPAAKAVVPLPPDSPYWRWP